MFREVEGIEGDIVAENSRCVSYCCFLKLLRYRNLMCSIIFFQNSEQDIKRMEEENDELRKKVKTLEELAVSANGSCSFWCVVIVIW